MVAAGVTICVYATEVIIVAVGSVVVPEQLDTAVAGSVEAEIYLTFS